MESKGLTRLMAVVGGIAGGYVPLLWGAGYFSFASIIFSALGAILGIWVAFRMTH